MTKMKKKTRKKRETSIRKAGHMKTKRKMLETRSNKWILTASISELKLPFKGNRQQNLIFKNPYAV